MTNYTLEQRERAARQIWPRAGEDWLRMVSAKGSSFEYRVMPQCVINAQAEELKEARELLISVGSKDEQDKSALCWCGSIWSAHSADCRSIRAWLQRNEVKA